MVELFGTLENYTTNYSTTSLSAICHLAYYFDGFFPFFFYAMMCWHVFQLLFSSFYLQYMIFIWFSDGYDSQNVTDPLLQNTVVYSNIRLRSGMAFYKHK